MSAVGRRAEAPWKQCLLPLLFLLATCVAPSTRSVALAPATQKSSTQGGEKSTPEAQSPEKNQQEADENEAYRHSAAVKMLAAKLGMTPEQAATVFEVTNFAVLAALVAWFLVRALPKTFRNRTGAIQKHLVEARMATEEATARMNSVENRLSKLDEQISGMRDQAEKDSLAEERRIKAAVEEEKQKILASAEQEISAAATVARRQIQQFAADLAIDQAAKKLVVTAETDRLLIQSFARRLGSEGDKGGQN